MLSLQRAKPFCATAFQPPGKLSFRRFVHQTKAAKRKFRPKIPMCLQSITCYKITSLSDVEGWQAMHFGTAHSSIPVRKKIAFALPCHCPASSTIKHFFPSLHTAVFPSALVQLSIEKANAFPCSYST